jgi:hypothetical protein
VGGARDGPQLYVSVPYRRHRLQSYAKFYFVPLLMFLLLVLREHTDKSVVVGLGATLVLANIALLFISNNHVLTCEEQPVLLNTITTILAAAILTQDTSSWITFDNLSVALVTINTGLTLAMLGVHLCWGAHFARRARTLIKSGDFNAIDRM